MTNGCFKYGKKNHMIKNCPMWEVEWIKEISKRRNKKKKHVHDKKKYNKGTSKAIVAAWEECSDEDIDNDDDDDDNDDDDDTERALIAIQESEDKPDEESEIKNIVLKNKVHAIDTTVLELRSNNLKLKLGIGKEIASVTQLTLEKDIGKVKDELYKRDEHVRVLTEDLNKVKHELDRTCKWNMSSNALSWLQEHHSSNRRELGFGNFEPKCDPKSKYLTLPENKICTHCGNTGHYKSECTAKEKANPCEGDNQIWYIDSGCSKHMTGSKNRFLSLEDLKGCNVSVGNKKKGQIIGVGKMD
ncbi:uncharacterized protein [Nicotiana tomentosiformis]|uniref:uncharacterized protein n=1 Tax=Nicotiana tomentosiformis TaxID=4098 RepID=UPI00388CBA0A